MSEILVNKITAKTGTTITIAAGQTLNVAGTLTQTSGSIASASIADNAITNAKMADNAIGNAEMANDAIDSAELVAGSVDIAHLSASGTAQAGTYLQGNNSWGSINSVPDLTTEGDLYKNYKTIASDITIAVDANSNQGLIGPVAFTGDVTITGDLTIW